MATQTRMDLKYLQYLHVLVLNFNASLAIICFESFSTEAGWRLCWSTPENTSSCRNVDPDATTNIFGCDGYPNITSPRIAISVEKEFSFNITLKSGRKFPNVRLFLTMAEQTEVVIELEYSTIYSISCLSLGSLSKVSTSIIKSAGRSSKTLNVIYSYPNLSTFSELTISKEEIQSGHFTCRSTGNQKYKEAFNIFTRNSEWPLYPFVSHPELTIQSDEKGSSFIIPCRTIERSNSPPMLMTYTDGETQKMLSNEEMQTMTWDASVGFKFNTSRRTWEMRNFICKLNMNSFPSRTYLPTPNRFQTGIFVGSKGKQLGCTLGQRSGSFHLQASYFSKSQTAFHHECHTYSECDLNLESSTLVDEGSCNVWKDEEELSIELPIPDSNQTFGAFSCVLWHSYEGQSVPERSTSIYFLGLDANVYLLPGTYPNSSVIQISPLDEVLYRENFSLHVEFTCTTINFLRSEGTYFILRYGNSEEVTAGVASESPSLDWSSQFRFNVTLPKNTTQAICLVITTEGKIVSAERNLEIIDVVAPVIDHVANNSRTFKIGDLNNDLTISCPISGTPRPKYLWKFDNKDVDLFQGMDTRNLTFLVVNNQVEGRYTCEAWNQYGRNSFEFQISVQVERTDFATKRSDEHVLWVTFGAVLGVTLFSAAVIFAAKYFRAKRQIIRLTPEEKTKFLEGIPIPEGSSFGDSSDLAMHFPFTKCIESKSLVIDRNLTLGKGHHGIVYRGILHKEAVAVKTFKQAQTLDEFRACLVEVKLMEFVGEHPNIVLFLGADVTNIDKHEMLIVMELSPSGSLEKHLRMIKPTAQSNEVYAKNSHYCSVDERLICEKLFAFCEQIAFAMEHLENKKVIHGDLAARNILVFSHGVVKVTDFGYSRQLYQNDMYKPNKSRALPWRWASIELLRQMEFSTESDIWAFGVTVWEIFTFGNVPFASEKWNDHFMDSLENGMRLKKPVGLSESQYTFLKECWNLRKSARPRFLALKSFFSTEKDNLHLSFEIIRA